jgi:hypothetical protein
VSLTQLAGYCIIYAGGQGSNPDHPLIQGGIFSYLTKKIIGEWGLLVGNHILESTLCIHRKCNCHGYTTIPTLSAISICLVKTKSSLLA